MSKEPISHHYLPQFYLKGFGCKDISKKSISRLYTYDKVHFSKVVPKTTKEICCEKHRNTICIDNVNDYFIEKSFSELEGIMSEFFKVTKQYCSQLEEEKKAKRNCWDRRKYFVLSHNKSLSGLMNESYYDRLFNYFISVFYWRLTIHDDYFELNTTPRFLSSSIENIFNLSQTDSILKLDFFPNFLSEMKDDIDIPFMFDEQRELMKLYKNLIHPMSSLYSIRNRKYKLYMYNLAAYTLVGSDSPFIVDSGSPALSRRFIFTWSSKVAFINVKTTKKTMKNLNDWVFKISILNYLQAKRYVFCSDKKFLENVIMYSNMRYGKSNIEEIKNDLWALVD
ncbi:DUF4238 domain-containing protein [Vibrio parahaemolyticus]|nr:DUF4238 domain-containing protein [Vibrio parahaemolyticus]